MASPLVPGAGDARDTVQVLGDAATVRGFRLAGVAGAIIEPGAEARAAFARLREAGAALVVVTEAVAESLGGVETLARDGVRPLVVVLPSAREPGGGAVAAERLARGVQRALGLSVERRP